MQKAWICGTKFGPWKASANICYLLSTLFRLERGVWKANTYSGVCSWRSWATAQDIVAPSKV